MPSPGLWLKGCYDVLMTTFFGVARAGAVIAGGFAAGLIATSTLFPTQAKATDCGEPAPTTTELLSLEVPEADREFWQDTHD